MSTRAFITGVSGTELSAAERASVSAESPWDFIPFRLRFQIAAQALVSVGELTALRRIEATPAVLSIPVDGASRPVHPVTTSATMIAQVIRSAIEFQGLLMSHDVPMKALAGGTGERVLAIFAAGTPLHSNDNNAELDALTANTASA